MAPQSSSTFAFRVCAAREAETAALASLQAEQDEAALQQLEMEEELQRLAAAEAARAAAEAEERARLETEEARLRVAEREARDAALRRTHEVCASHTHFVHRLRTANMQYTEQ